MRAPYNKAYLLSCVCEWETAGAASLWQLQNAKSPAAANLGATHTFCTGNYFSRFKNLQFK